MQVVYLLEMTDNVAHLGSIVHPQLYRTVEDALVAGDDELVNVNVELIGQHLRDIAQHAFAVDASYLYNGIKEQHVVHIPFGVKQAVAITGLQLGRHRTGALVYLHMAHIVYVAQNVIAGYGMAAMWKDKLVDILFGNDDRQLLVEVFPHHDVLWLRSRLGVFLLLM